jgi:hypothetical protein
MLLQLADEALALYNACVRETLSACGGYESKEVAGMFMAAFQGPAAALEWALALQLALLQVPWPRLLLECQAGAVVKGCKQQVSQVSCWAVLTGSTAHFTSTAHRWPLCSARWCCMSATPCLYRQEYCKLQCRFHVAMRAACRVPPG